MKSHPYEYKVLVEYISPETKGKYPHFSHIEDQEGLTMTLEDVFEHLPECVPEGWEVNSHSLAISRGTLVVTILLRRPISEGTSGAEGRSDRERSDVPDLDHLG